MLMTQALGIGPNVGRKGREHGEEGRSQVLKGFAKRRSVNLTLMIGKPLSPFSRSVKSVQLVWGSVEDEESHL